MSNFPTVSSPREAVDSLLQFIENAQDPPSTLCVTGTRERMGWRLLDRAIAGTKALNPSLVVALSHLSIPTEDCPSPALISATLNAQLPSLYSQKVHIAAVHWTAKGNLIVTAGPSTPSKILYEASPHIAQALHKGLRQAPSAPTPPVRPNVRWSKVLIHGVPTNASGSQGPSSPNECHEALLATNPSYSSLLITRKPSWVRAPSSYKPGSASSLVMAFKDPDGSALRSLLQNRYLYIFGTQAKASDSTNEEDVNIILDTPTPTRPVASASLRSQALPSMTPPVATASNPPTKGHDRPPKFSPPTTQSSRK
ncbi:hypothetical protein BC827DRAFT_1272622 [Russula dissimulans]|nr:hypothetical protein BC827DRAFT_1272622 [Russula dissimulans]